MLRQSSQPPWTVHFPPYWGTHRAQLHTTVHTYVMWVLKSHLTPITRPDELFWWNWVMFHTTWLDQGSNIDIVHSRFVFASWYKQDISCFALSFESTYVIIVVGAWISFAASVYCISWILKFSWSQFTYNDWCISWPKASSIILCQTQITTKLLHSLPLHTSTTWTNQYLFICTSHIAT